MKYIPNAVSRTVAKQILITQKNSPTLLFGAGIVGVVATAVLASKATLKLEETLDSHYKNRTLAAEMLERQDEKYSEADYRKDVVLIQIRSTIAVCKLYAPAILVGTATVGALFTSQRILNKRNAALVAAYSVLEKGFNDYRARIAEEYGEEREVELYRDIRKVEETVDGKTKKVKRIGRGSIYARFFDKDASRSWSEAHEYNVVFLRQQQNYFNDMLRAKGHVFLNEVYDGLGLERSQPGAVVGWIWQGNGDSFIDFGIFDNPNSESFYEFVLGNGGIWLDFNVDGVIYNKI